MSQDLTPSSQGDILIVDDSPANLKFLTQMLSAQGYRVRVALSAKLALKSVESVLPDLILLDIVMPEMNGYEACERLKASLATKEIPVIFISALDETFDKVKAFSIGGVDYITQPFEPEEILARVQTHLRLRSLTKQLQEQNTLLQQQIRDRESAVRHREAAVKHREAAVRYGEAAVRHRIRAEQALQKTEIGLHNHNQVLIELIRHQAIHQGDLKSALKEITEATAHNIAVERTSIWLFDSTDTYLQCLDLFERSFNQHSSGIELATAECATYIQALTQEHLIVADDAQKDPRTQEFLQSYLIPLGITSMLDAPIHVAGKTVGVLCCEQVSIPRQWTAQDQNFTRSAANLVALALEARERRRTQMALQASEEKFAKAFRCSPDSLAIATLSDGCYIDVNDSFCNLFGYSREEIIGYTAIDLQLWVDSQQRILFTHQLQQQGIVRNQECNYHTKSGEVRTVLLSAEIIEVGGESCILSVCTDISDRKRTEQEMHSARAFLDSIIENIPHGIFVKDATNLRFVRFNKAGEKLLGYSRQELINKNDYDCFPKEQADFFTSKDREALASETVVDIPEEVIQTPDKGLRILHTKKIGIRDAAGKPQYLLAIAEDITERKQAASEAVRNAAALAESEQKYRDLVETSQDIIWSVDNRGCITFVNQAVKQILGYEPEEMLGHPFADFAAPEQLALDLKGLQYVLNGESVLGYEAIYLAKDGRAIHLLRNAIPKRDSEGRVIGATGTASDITARQQVEEALRQQLKQQQLVKAIAARIRSSLHLEDVLKTTVEQVREFLQTDRTIVYRFRPDWSGDVVVESVGEGWVKSIGQNIHDPCFGESMVVPYQHGRISNIEDIYTAGLEQCFIDLLKHYQVRADVVVPILLQSGDEVNSEERSVPMLWGLLVAHHCRSPRQWHESEIESLRQLSVQLAIAIQQSTLFEQAQAEIADRKRAEAALEAAKEAAEVANRSKSIFLANMSHELRTPLNVILGFTQLINRDSSLSREQREHLDIIMRSGEHLLELIDDILEMSKIEAGRITLNETSFDLYRLLDSLQEMFQLKAQSKGLQLIFERANDVPQYVQADEGKLRQVLINLLSNALKFTERGRVMLHVVRTLNVESSNLQPTNLAFGFCFAVQPANLQPVTLTFEVSDTGPGIVPEEIDLLFETFTQTTTGRTANEGTGLGLPISRSFVQLMGGEFAVNSTLGQGTTFRFDIPLQFSCLTDMQPTQAAGRVIGLAPGQTEYRILVVEDKWASRQLLVKLLTSIGFAVKEAENGQEAVAIWSSWQPHLIFMDMRMPVMDGYEATRQIKAREQAKRNVETDLKGQQETSQSKSSPPKSTIETGQITAIIALTASAFEEQRSAILSVGCDDFIRKPFREEILLEKIATYLGVRYTYKNSPHAPALRAAQRVELITDEALTVMPREWIAQLHRLAEACNDEEILVLLNEIPEEYASLKLSLVDLVKDFRLDLILDITGSQ